MQRFFKGLKKTVQVVEEIVDGHDPMLDHHPRSIEFISYRDDDCQAVEERLRSRINHVQLEFLKQPDNEGLLFPFIRMGIFKHCPEDICSDIFLVLVYDSVFWFALNEEEKQLWIHKCCQAAGVKAETAVVNGYSNLMNEIKYGVKL